MREMNMRVFWELLLRNLRPIIVVVALLATAFAVYTSAFTTVTYASKCSMYVMNITEDSAVDVSGISAAGLDASQRMVNEYITILKSSRVVTKVHDALQAQGYNTSVSGVRNALSMTAVDETAMLQITATTSNPQLSKDMCDALQAVAPEEVNDVMLGIGHITKVDEAERGTKSQPPVVRNGLFGALIGLALSYGFFLMGYLMDNTVKEEKDLKERFDVNVLGAVPSFSTQLERKPTSKKEAKKETQKETKKEKAAKKGDNGKGGK